MAAKRQLRLTANINFPRSEEIDGKDSTMARHGRFTRGATIEVGKDVSAERAKWLVDHGHAEYITAKEAKEAAASPASSASTTPSSNAYGGDEAVQDSTREASEEHEKPASEIEPTGGVSADGAGTTMSGPRNSSTADKHGKHAKGHK